MLGRVVRLLVDPHHDGEVLVLGGRGDDHLARAGGDVGLGLLGVGEQTRRLDDDVGAQVAPRELAGIALGEHFDLAAVDGQDVAVHRHGAGEGTEDGVVLEQMSQRRRSRDVVDSDDLDVRSLLTSGAKDVASDAAEAVDADLDSHELSSRFRGTGDPSGE